MKKNFFVVMLLFGLSTIITSCNQEKHEYVDLGLPSGTLWAKCNIGAETPFDGGSRFAWGETEPKEEFNEVNYKFFKVPPQEDGSYLPYYNDMDEVKVSKYNEEDGKTVLDRKDDAAHVNWGGKWRIPTNEDWLELVKECRWEKRPGGYLFIGANGNSIFFPYPEDDDYNWEAIYWGAKRKDFDSHSAYCINFTDMDNFSYMEDFTLTPLGYFRCGGFYIRPVIHKHSIMKKRNKNS